jgi:hypothetical protein
MNSAKLMALSLDLPFAQLVKELTGSRRQLARKMAPESPGGP